MAIEEEAVPNAAKFMREVLRGSSYEFSTALADLVDNSIQANCSNVEIFVDFDELTVAVFDDGKGMTDETHKEAMKVASETRDYEDADLGKYGTGMKAASLSQADRLVVATKPDSSSEVTVRCLDIDHINRVNDWSRLTLVLSVTDLPSKYQLLFEEHNSGTLVLWESLGRVSDVGGLDDSHLRLELMKQLEAAESHLSMVFHRFLDGTIPNGKQLCIRVNGEQLEPWDPFCLDEKTIQLEPFETKFNGSVVRLSPYILPGEKEFSSKAKFFESAGPKRWNESQGFYVYRNYRLIRWGGWLRMRASDEHRKLARIALDFGSDLDSVFRVNVAKSSLTLPMQVKTRFEPIVKECAAQAEKRYRSQKKIAAGGIGSLPGRGTGSGNTVTRKISANTFVSLLEQIANASNLESELKSLKAATAQQNSTLAREVGWD